MGGLPTANSDKILQLMRLHNLSAVNTMFEPPHGSSVHTYLHTRSGDDLHENGDLGEFVGSKTMVTYKNREIKGRVNAMYADERTGKRTWVVNFEDGYVKKYVNRTSVQRIIVRTKLVNNLTIY